MMNYSKIVSKGSFIDEYMKEMSPLETPLSYDFWSACWCISTIVGRDVYVNRPMIPVHLNMYVILVAESGITRKGANITKASKLVTGLVPEVLHNKTTPTQLEIILHEQSRLEGTAYVAICCPEMTSILGRETGLKRMPELLTDIYDCHKERKGGGSLESGRIKHTNVYPTMLTASTPSWLGTAINPSVIEGGFTSRCIFVCAKRRKQVVAWPDQSSENVANTTRSRLLLGRIQRDVSRNPAINVNRNGLDYFKRWYKNRGMSTDAFRSSFEAREDEHVLRLAAILCINDGIFEIQLSHIKHAIKLIQQHKQDAADMFGVDSKRTRTIGDGINKLRDIFAELGENEPIGHTKLYTKLRFSFSIEEFKLLIKVMHECDLIKIYQIRGRKGNMYAAKEKLLQPGSITEAIEKLSLHQ